MFLGVEKERLGPSEIRILYQDAWRRINQLFAWTLGDEKSRKMEGRIELQDGYKIEAKYLPTTWMEVRVSKEDEGVLSFVMRESGLGSIRSRNPSLSFGKREVKLVPFGIGLEGELQAVSYPIEQSENMDILGVRLVEWLEGSVKAGKLKPLDVSVKFPLLPQK